LTQKTLRSLQFGMHWFPERQGGLDRVYYELSRALPEAGVESHGLIAGTDRSARDTGGAVLAFSPANVGLAKRWLGMRRAFTKYMQTHKPDLLVSHFALYTLPVLDRLGNRKLVVHFHGPWADEGSVEGNTGLRHSIKRWVENLVYRRAARAIVLSNAFAEVLVENYNFPRDRIHVIPGGIDTKRFAVTETREAARARLGWPVGRPTIVAVRRLVPRMGLENLVAAIAIVIRDIPDILVKIAGRGALQSQLTEQIEKSGLSGNISLTGFVSDEDLPYFYRAADLSVVPTVALEGFGLIAAESLAAGTPCLVSPVGGLPEVVSALSQNLVLRSPAVADIAEAIGAALQGRLSLPDDASCRAYAAKHFDWQIIAAKVAEVYRLAAQ
jgi:glycosyltransferase involved in cell wall biosynthesis